MPFTLDLRGTVVAVTDEDLQMRVTAVSAWPMRQRQSKLKRRLLLTVPTEATVQRVPKVGAPGTEVALSSAKPGQQVDVWTATAPTTLRAQRGDDGVLNASLVSLVVPTAR
jgi:hypothetical protein